MIAIAQAQTQRLISQRDRLNTEIAASFQKVDDQIAATSSHEVQVGREYLNPLRLTQMDHTESYKRCPPPFAEQIAQSAGKNRAQSRAGSWVVVLFLLLAIYGPVSYLLIHFLGPEQAHELHNGQSALHIQSLYTGI